MKHSLILCAITAAVLSACGGGSSDSATIPAPQPTQPVPAPTLTLSSQTLRTIAGGAPVSLEAQASSGTVRWKLADGAPGKLSAETGNTVTYTPPASGIAGPTMVTVTASVDGASTSLTLAVTPDPGPAGLYAIAGHPNPSSIDGTGAEASFPFAKWLATDGTGNIYVLQNNNMRPSQMTPPILRKITPDGKVTTLPRDKYANHMPYSTGLAADRAGNLYVSSGLGFGKPGETIQPTAILKITPAGDVSLLAGSEEMHTAAMTDGTGAAARFLHPVLVGSDYDGNLYVRDANDTPRKVTPAGVVTTLKAFPAGLNADMNGNTYRFDEATKSLLRISPTGASSVVAGAPTCTDFVPGPLPGCLNYVLDIVPLGGASFAYLGGNGVARIVLPR